MAQRVDDSQVDALRVWAKKAKIEVTTTAAGATFNHVGVVLAGDASFLRLHGPGHEYAEIGPMNEATAKDGLKEMGFDPTKLPVGLGGPRVRLTPKEIKAANERMAKRKPE